MKLPTCPLCKTPTDFQDTTFRNHPFVDGQRYDFLCFTCAHVPEDYIQRTKNGVTEEVGPLFDHKHLCSAQTLVDIGSAETLTEARRSVKAVREAIKKAGPKLKKMKLKRPPHHTYNVLEQPETPKKKRPTKKKKSA